MNQEKEIRKCQNCKKDFVIEPEDFAFYEKMKVPAPTFCPDCRLLRRTVFRNETYLYNRKCDSCQDNIVSIYSKDSPFKVYCNKCYHSDSWDFSDYSQDFDSSKSFLEQFRQLQLKVPRIHSFLFKNEDSPYVNGAAFNKKCYLIFVSDYNKNSMYSYSIFNCNETLDSMSSKEIELSYNNINCEKSYRVNFSQDCTNSQNLFFCKNLRNCNDCIGCINLRNKSYCIFNKQYSKEEYEKKKEDMLLNTYSGIEKLKKDFREIENNFPQKHIHGSKNQDVSGDYIFNNKNSYYIYNSHNLENCKYIIHGDKSKYCYDGHVVIDNSEYSLEIVGAISLNNVKYGYNVWTNFDVEYSDTCENSNNLFGCVGANKNSYCILNKQYTKEEYFKMVEKIKKHMNDMPYIDKQGNTYKYGEFFPPELSPFAYNETIAQEYFPLTKQEAIKKGYNWKEREERNYQITLKTEQIPDNIKDVTDDITKEIIQCKTPEKERELTNCTEAFKIIPQELEFYKKLNLPLPRYCPNCRHYHRLKQRNPLKLYKRTCMKEGCNTEFETTYAPDRPEIVYCEKCYQEEVV